LNFLVNGEEKIYLVIIWLEQKLLSSNDNLLPYPCYKYNFVGNGSKVAPYLSVVDVSFVYRPAYVIPFSITGCPFGKQKLLAKSELLKLFFYCIPYERAFRG
jgi:hypothetical protein